LLMVASPGLGTVWMGVQGDGWVEGSGFEKPAGHKGGFGLVLFGVNLGVRLDV
jgi:hypothetical protein